MRGRERIVVAGVLLASSACTGALFGFAVGLVGVALDVERVSPWLVVGALVATVVLDRLVAPPSVRSQVPQLWGRIFSPRATALLYGARLGVGPLTILRTWWWWLAIVFGALAGVWPSVAVGAAFGAGRILVMLPVGTRAGAMRRRERAAIASSVVVAVVLGVAVVAFDSSSRSASGRASDDAQVSTRSERDRGGATDDNDGTSTSPSSTEPSTRMTVAEDPALAAQLPEQIGDGFTRVADDDGEGLGPLDLTRAAAAEPDTSAERALLETRHFERGHARAWRHDDGRLAYAAVYQFASGGDASAYLVDGFITLDSRGARVYDVTDVAGGRGFSQAGSDGSGSEIAHGVAFVRDRRFFLVFVSSTDSSATAAGATALARTVDAARIGVAP